MKALLFNHHPDYLWYTKTLFESLGIETDVATEELTFSLGADYCSVSKNFKFQCGKNWYDPKILFPNTQFSYSNTHVGYDYYFSINPTIAENLPYDATKNIFGAVVIWHILQRNDFKKYKKISSVDYIKSYGGTRITYFIPQRGELKEKKYITQLMESYKTRYFDEMMHLRQSNPVIIAGHPDAPDGIVDDWSILSRTRLLVHHKEYGSCCNAVMKALDCGIPIYMSRENRYKLGFEDIPEFCFIFSDDHNITQAYEISNSIDNSLIQSEFRKVKNLEKAKEEFKTILNIKE
jgi:hypothetical protein